MYVLFVSAVGTQGGACLGLQYISCIQPEDFTLISTGDEIMSLYNQYISTRDTTYFEVVSLVLFDLLKRLYNSVSTVIFSI